MDKQKQIEEIYIPFKGEKKQIYFDLVPSCQMIFSKFGYGIIDTIYDLGYRKIPENAVVLTEKDREEFNELYRSALQRAEKWEKLCGIKIKETRKETAEKFAERLKDLVAERNCNEDYDWEDVQVDGQIFVECVDEIAKEFTEGKV